MQYKLIAIIGLVVGLCLIIFRKKLRNRYLRKHFEEKLAPKKLEYRQQWEEMELEGILHKGLELVAIVFGVFVILMSISELFTPVGKYIRYFITYSILTFFAACVSILIEFKLLSSFLLRNVHNYYQEHYGNSHQWNKLFGSVKINASNSEAKHDRVLRNLQKKATVKSIICFVPLFTIILSIFLFIFIATNK